jgi:hypothetical protein
VCPPTTRSSGPEALPSRREARSLAAEANRWLVDFLTLRARSAAPTPHFPSNSISERSLRRAISPAISPESDLSGATSPERSHHSAAQAEHRECAAWMTTPCPTHRDRSCILRVDGDDDRGHSGRTKPRLSGWR